VLETYILPSCEINYVNILSVVFLVVGMTLILYVPASIGFCDKFIIVFAVLLIQILAVFIFFQHTDAAF